MTATSAMIKTCLFEIPTRSGFHIRGSVASKGFKKVLKEVICEMARGVVADNQTSDFPLLWAYRGKVGFLSPMKHGSLQLQQRRVARASTK